MNNLIEVTDDKNIKTSDYLGPLIQNDHIDKIIFKIKKNYGDIDLSTYGFTLIYVIANKEKSGDISTEASGEITKTIEDDYILLTWSIPHQATSQDGELKIQIVANLNDSYWHSRIGVFQVYSELVPSEADFTPSLLSQVEEVCTTISLYSNTISQTKQDIIALTEEAFTSEGNAKTSEENAAISESNASTSEKNAKASEESAVESKEAASTSEEKAKTSEENAASSEQKAKTSEGNAKTSEENAAESKEAAATSEENASSMYAATKQEIENGNILSNVNNDLYSMGVSLVASRPQIKYTKLFEGD